MKRETPPEGGISLGTRQGAEATVAHGRGEVNELLSLGVSPCSVMYRTATPDPAFLACGRPQGHSGPHWAEASQTDVADLAGIRRLP